MHGAHMKNALVLGGGIQGCCIALMLRKHGYEVTIVDKSEDIFNRASINQQGKIHLGFNWGLDTSLKTGKKLMLDALYFAPYLEYLLDEKINWEKLKSTNFNALVAKDSLLSSDEIGTDFQARHTIYLIYMKNEKLTDLGKRPERLFQKTLLPKQVNPDLFQSCFATEEVALRTEGIKKIIKEKIHSENISLCLNQHVTSAKRTSSGFIVETHSEKEGVRQLESDMIFNCLWEGKMALDKEMGMQVEKGYNLRLRYGIIAKMSTTFQDLQSFGVIQGPYGDFVNYPQSKEAFFSWYPSSMKGMVVDQNMPPRWEEACDGHISDTLKQNLINENFNHYHRLMPTLTEFEDPTIVGGVILAKGYHDIDDPNSKLHERNEFPITQDDGYVSINTGKFTSAPHNTLLLEKMLGYQSTW